ncbi:hypothetical protein B0O99DRAFT_735476 [Bisporella sp. PMI_857]|nr:hypothetical protein B0O99DRAFT_735476 [Bisporella sp. PMI_857]
MLNAHYDIYSFPTDASLAAHGSHLHHHRCGNCEKTFRTEAARDMHFRDVHILYCDHCDWSSTSNERLRAHLHSKHEFFCRECNRNFTSSNARASHYANAAIHNHTCIKCHQKFVNATALQEHYDSTHVFKCVKCPATFETQVLCQEHHDSAHVFKCAKCIKAFETLESHQQHHESAHEFKCKSCSYVSDTLTSCEQHYAVVHAIKCPWCGEPIRNQALLEHHQAVHHAPCMPVCIGTKSMPYQPFVEEDSVVKGQILTFHNIAFHHKFSAEELRLADYAQGYRYFGLTPCSKCRYCTATFTTPELRDGHESVHAFDCGLCRESFALISGLLHHQRLQHPLIKCSRCLETFENGDGLIQHHLSVHMPKINDPENKTPPGERTAPAQSENSNLVMNESSALIIFGSQNRVTTLENDESALDATNSSALIEPETTDDANTSDSESKFLQKTTTKYPKELSRKIASQDLVHTCGDCNITFESDLELHVHVVSSPFHMPRSLDCYECGVSFPDQFILLRHIESKAHTTRWVLTMV